MVQTSTKIHPASDPSSDSGFIENNAFIEKTMNASLNTPLEKVERHIPCCHHSPKTAQGTSACTAAFNCTAMIADCLASPSARFSGQETEKACL